MCVGCGGSYIGYYNYTLNHKTDPKTPMKPDKYIEWKKSKIKSSKIKAANEFWRDIDES